MPWRESLEQGVHPLDDGTLYVAKFNANGAGRWLPLTPSNPVLATKMLAPIRARARRAGS